MTVQSLILLSSLSIIVRPNSDDDDNPFDNFFSGIGGMMNSGGPGEMEHVDIHEYDDRIKVIADIPGVKENRITLQCDGRNLAIHAPTETQPFIMQVDLPTYVDNQPSNTSYNNGILEITLDRENDPANIGFQ